MKALAYYFKKVSTMSVDEVKKFMREEEFSLEANSYDLYIKMS